MPADGSHFPDTETTEAEIEAAGRAAWESSGELARNPWRVGSWEFGSWQYGCNQAREEEEIEGFEDTSWAGMRSAHGTWSV